MLLVMGGPKQGLVIHQHCRTTVGKSSESVQCAITGPCLRMRHRPSAYTELYRFGRFALQCSTVSMQSQSNYPTDSLGLYPLHQSCRLIIRVYTKFWYTLHTQWYLQKFSNREVEQVESRQQVYTRNTSGSWRCTLSSVPVRASMPYSVPTGLMPGVTVKYKTTKTRAHNMQNM